MTTGAVSLPPDEQVDAMASLVHQAFDEHGFDHYEISSYARPGRRSRHNVKYWTYVPYLGFGVSLIHLMAVYGQRTLPIFLSISVTPADNLYWRNPSLLIQNGHRKILFSRIAYA